MMIFPIEWNVPEPEVPGKPPTVVRPDGMVEKLCVSCGWWYYLDKDSPVLLRRNYVCKMCEEQGK